MISSDGFLSMRGTFLGIGRQIEGTFHTSSCNSIHVTVKFHTASPLATIVRQCLYHKWYALWKLYKEPQQ